MEKLMLGDNIESLKNIPPNSVDSVVTDPPYGLSFMNKKWDHSVPSIDFWKEVYRVLKPGGHVLSFGGTRTYHRMVVNMEDAGFEIRDQIMWIYGQGFPKSLNIGKAIDKLQGNEREEWLDDKKTRPNIRGNWTAGENTPFEREPIAYSKGNSEWEGFGTALKPANEPICVARKPISEKTIALNVLKWGTGGINIDGCRIGSGGGTKRDSQTPYNELGWRTGHSVVELNEGRFPSNVIFECICDDVIKGEKGEVKKTTRGRKYESGDSLSGITMNNKVEGVDNYNDKGDIHTNPGCPCYMLDKQSGISKSKKSIVKGGFDSKVNTYVGGGGIIESERGHSDKGGSSRFFYNAKVSSKERNMGLDNFEKNRIEGRDEGQDERNVAYKSRPSIRANTHPTVKPVNLMRYLCKLITPPNGIVLDPFMGSGSTGIAAKLEGFQFWGMEMDENYFKVSKDRIDNYLKYDK